MSAAPCIRDQMWSMSKYVMGQLNSIVKAPNNQKVTLTFSLFNLLAMVVVYKNPVKFDDR